WQSKQGKNVFPPSGSGYDPGKFYYFSSYNLLGYFEGMENLPISLQLKKPDELDVKTGLDYDIASNNDIVFKASNYEDLKACPIVVCNKETATITVKGTKFYISVYSETGKSYINLIKNDVEPYLRELGSFFDKMPVENYSIMIYIRDVEKWGDKYRSGKLGLISFFRMLNDVGKMGFGANGYKKGTSFCLADMGNDYYLTESLKSTLIHEFIHIVTPNKFFSDLEKPREMNSKHVWLWEGVTVYFENLVQLKGGLLTMNEFLTIMRRNILDSYQFPKDVSFTEFSEKINEKPYKKYVMQWYYKGSVIAMLLDFEIMKLTNGEKTLKSVVFKIAEKYSKEKKSIDEDEVFNEFVKEVDPELQVFFDRFVSGTEELDVRSGYNVIGYEYLKQYADLFPTDPVWNNDIKKGKFIIPPDTYNPEYVILESGENDFIGFQEGDRVKRFDINKTIIEPSGKMNPDGMEVILPIIRDNQKIEIPFKIKYIKRTLTYYTREIKEKTPEQQNLFQIFIK
ncbi:MAG: hypothetical protein K8R74_07800, partial [Bacteroidales bacterium]|nr:hypothetical protein [Bacteroidales bacterium]